MAPVVGLGVGVGVGVGLGVVGTGLVPHCTAKAAVDAARVAMRIASLTFFISVSCGSPSIVVQRNHVVNAPAAQSQLHAGQGFFGDRLLGRFGLGFFVFAGHRVRCVLEDSDGQGSLIGEHVQDVPGEVGFLAQAGDLASVSAFGPHVFAFNAPVFLVLGPVEVGRLQADGHVPGRQGIRRRLVHADGAALHGGGSGFGILYLVAENLFGLRFGDEGAGVVVRAAADGCAPGRSDGAGRGAAAARGGLVLVAGGHEDDRQEGERQAQGSQDRGSWEK